MTEAVVPVLVAASQLKGGPPRAEAALCLAFKQGQAEGRLLVAELEDMLRAGAELDPAETRLLEAARLVVHAATTGATAFRLEDERLVCTDRKLALQSARAVRSAWRLATTPPAADDAKVGEQRGPLLRRRLQGLG